MQFSAIPMNLFKSEEGDRVANYLTTGTWSQGAIKEAKKFCTKANEVANNSSTGYSTVPDEWQIADNATYFHYCDNETIQGIEFHDFPFDRIGEQTLVSDMSSNFCSKPIDWSKYGVVYAGAQKNVGPSGVCFGVIRNDLIPGHMKETPLLCDW